MPKGTTMKITLHRWLSAGLLAALALGTASAKADELTGTLKKARAVGYVVIGYRESSVPFSFIAGKDDPVGYSIDLCRAIVAAMSEEVGRELPIKWVAVTSETRLPAVISGDIDLECGSTTQNAERAKQVGFSPIMFVAGTKLMVKKGSPIKSFTDLRDKTVVVTAGTTNEKAIKDLNDKFKVGLKMVVARDHAESYGMVASGFAEAFATDDVLLFGQIAKNKAQGQYFVVGDFLSYDPYGIMYQKGDLQLKKLIDTTFANMAEERELEQTYKKWFLSRLPSGDRINLPMSAQLNGIFKAMVTKPE